MTIIEAKRAVSDGRCKRIAGPYGRMLGRTR
jgi:hypothetical protein